MKTQIVVGDVNIAPVGTKLPEDIASSLDAKFKTLGHLGSDGVYLGRTTAILTVLEDIEIDDRPHAFVARVLNEDQTRAVFVIPHGIVSTFTKRSSSGTTVTDLVIDMHDDLEGYCYYIYGEDKL